MAQDFDPFAIPGGYTWTSVDDKSRKMKKSKSTRKSNCKEKEKEIVEENVIRSQASRPIKEYPLDLKAATDELAFLNQLILEDDLILYIVNGLSPTFKDISVAIRTKNDSIILRIFMNNLLNMNLTS
ncbi:hypothetical protein FEM48_Zijuj11G0041200 [Ziziphus jujuba var. spinosa]|uniref:Uncharacterized protein n=1 Tax=Ziziphus jujuba var. spinosa TaxID=714518 RepID=A0A978UGQ9_ZIZJJ|nr:hypothetical protein FEM48_Zijuj11G0041200 [Ziziphus jujuba var. spinosa]